MAETYLSINMRTLTVNAEPYLVSTERRFEFFLFLTGYFFSRVVWGSNNEGFFLNLGMLQICIAIYATYKFTPPIKWIQLTTLIFLILLVLEIWYALRGRSLPGNEDEYLVAVAKLWGYLFGLILYALTIRRKDISVFCDAFIKLSVFSVWLALICTVIYLATGLGMLMNFYGGTEYIVRAQAFFSEPSAFAPVIATILIVGYHKRDVRLIVWGLLGMAITLSPIVILTVVLTGFIYLFFFKSQSKALLSLVMVAASILVYLVLATDCISMIESDNPLFVLTGRTACGVQSLVDEDMSLQIGNPRLASAHAVTEVLQGSDAIWSGFGLNSSSVFMGQLYDEVQENSFWLSLILFYGVVGVAVFALLCIFAFTRIRRAPIELSVLFVALMVASTINSAEGFYLYGLFLLAMVVLITNFSEGRPTTSGNSSIDVNL